MGKYIARCVIGTHDNIENKLAILKDMHQIKNADVYWSDDGTLAVIAAKKWADYLTGKSQESPFDGCDNIGGDYFPAVNEEEYLELLFNMKE